MTLLGTTGNPRGKPVGKPRGKPWGIMDGPTGEGKLGVQFKLGSEFKLGAAYAAA